MLLSCSAKKVTKEGGIGEALSSALPRRKTPPLETPVAHLASLYFVTNCPYG